MIKQQALFGLFKIEADIKENVKRLSALRTEKETSEASLFLETKKMLDLKAKISELNLQVLGIEGDINSIRSNIEENEHKSQQLSSKITSEAKKCASMEENLNVMSNDIQKTVNHYWNILGTNYFSLKYRKRQITISLAYIGRNSKF